MTDVLLILTGYLLGSMPWGYWLPRMLKGVNIREEGSGSTGAANVWRTAGFKIRGADGRKANRLRASERESRSRAHLQQRARSASQYREPRGSASGCGSESPSHS